MQDEVRTGAPDTATSDTLLARRGLMLRDTLAFLALTLIVVVLFVVTLLLFRSFTARRALLAARWTDRGTAALAAGHPEEAVIALRNALTYDPDERSGQLLLAQALGAAGHTEESTTYFLNLWQLTPGDGFINLELARLARQAGHQDDAVHYYRAAIYGSWQSDAVARRRDVRDELLQYLIAQRDFTTARAELLIAASDAPNSVESDIIIAGEFVAIEDPATALIWYQKALARDPHDPEALYNSGQISAQLGDTPAAIDYLQRALNEPPRRRSNGEPKLTLDQRTAGEALLTQLEQAAAAQERSLKTARYRHK
jgi:tetratricopeptide (TPR) repeat protein